MEGPDLMGREERHQIRGSIGLLAAVFFLASLHWVGERANAAESAGSKPAARWSGDFLFLSGVTGTENGAVVPGGIQAQTRRAAQHLVSGLEAHGLDSSRLVSLDIYLADLSDFAAFWQALVEAFEGRLPSGAAVGVGLPQAGARVQLAAVAAAPGVEIRRIQPEGWLGADAPGSLATLAGDVLFVSGMAAFDPATMTFVGGDIGEQTRRTLENLRDVLTAAKLDFGQVSRCRVFLSNLAQVDAMDMAFEAAWGESPLPNRTVLGVRLLGPGNLFGLQCVASRRASAPPFFLSGYAGNMAGKKDVELEIQAVRAWRAVAASRSDSGTDPVASLTVYLTDPARHVEALGALNKAFGAERPAVTVVGAGQPDAQTLIVLEAVVGGSTKAAPGTPR